MKAKPQQVQGQHRLEHPQGRHPGIAGNDAVETEVRLRAR
jgi:hypothetical protein